VHLCGKHPRVLRPGIASFSENSGFTKTNHPKLFEEGAAYTNPSFFYRFAANSCAAASGSQP
jgi:hypothetical protein